MTSDIISTVTVERCGAAGYRLVLWDFDTGNQCSCVEEIIEFDTLKGMKKFLRDSSYNPTHIHINYKYPVVKAPAGMSVIDAAIAYMEDRCILPLSVKELRDTTGRLAKDLGIGTACIEIVSTYSDYVTLRFALFFRSGHISAIEIAFSELAKACGWMAPRVIGHDTNNTIVVQMQKTNVIITSDERLPDAVDRLELRL